MLKEDQVLACNAVLNCSGHSCLRPHVRLEDSTCKQHLSLQACIVPVIDHSSPCKRDQVEQHTASVTVTTGQLVPDMMMGLPVQICFETLPLHLM